MPTEPGIWRSRIATRLAALPTDVVVAGAAATVVGIGLTALVAIRVAGGEGDRIPAGVFIEGIPVGRLSTDEAERIVRASARPSPPAVLTILAPRGSAPVLRVPVSRLDPRPQIREALAEAARRPSVGFRIRRELGLGGRRDVSVAFRLRPAEIERVIDRVARETGRPPRPAGARVAGDQVVLSPARSGLATDRPDLRRRLARLPQTVRAAVVPVEPVISDRDAEIAREQALRIARGPVTITAGRRHVSIGRAALLRTIVFRPEGGGLRASIDPLALRPLLASSFAVVERRPRPARFRIRGGRARVVASVAGRRIDFAATARDIERRSADRMPLRTRAVEARFTTRVAEDLRIRELIGEFTTPYACCEPRVTNIRRAAEVLDGLIIRAGAEFDLNKALGQRTPGRGFVPAPQINAGRLEDAVGGGVSQVATTFFNAAFFAGLRIVTHTPHEFWITRYPAGREATISWGGPELIVQNDWPAGILVKVSATDDGITVRLFSSRLGRRVSTETFATPSAGSAFRVTYTRRVTRVGRVVKDERFTWSYRAPPPAD